MNRALLLLAVSATLAGCPKPPPTPTTLPERLRDTRTAVQVEAMIEAADRGETSVIPLLIERLSSTDSAVRMYAILALQRMTGQTMGYRYYDSVPDRQAAIGRWKQWLPATTRPGGAAAPRT